MTDQYEAYIEIEDEDLNRSAKKVLVKWIFIVEHRSWGVKSMIAIVPDQKIYVTWTQDNPVTGETESVNEELDIKDCDTDLDVKLTGDLICPSELVISGGRFTIRF